MTSRRLKELADARKQLDRAREATRSEWSLERSAGDRVVRQLVRERHAFVEQHISELLATERAAAEPLASEVNQLASRLIELHGLLAIAEQRTVALVHVAYPNNEWMDSAPRSGPLAQASEALLAEGGERAPAYEPRRPVAIGGVA